MQDAEVRYSMSDDRMIELNERAQKYGGTLRSILDESHKRITGQHHALERMLIGVITDGHVLVESVPGLAKTLMVKTMSQIFGADSVRIQFTPDLLPADIIGTKIYAGRREDDAGGTASGSPFVTEKGPIFHSFVLADEINRAPPKVQSALLEAMQERQVSIHGDTYELGKPFLVFATQNPIENEGTYRLPEAQIDRFAMKLAMTYPTKEEEMEIISKNAAGSPGDAPAISSPEEAAEMQGFCEGIYVDELVSEYVTDVVRATRDPDEYGIKGMSGTVELGASPRASIWLVRTARGRALVNGRGFVTPEDVKEMAHDVLRHRIIPTFEAEERGITPDAVISGILEGISPP